jgi:hypothetical protein
VISSPNRPQTTRGSTTTSSPPTGDGLQNLDALKGWWIIELLVISLWRPKVRANLVGCQLRMTGWMNFHNLLRKVRNMVKVALFSDRQDITAGTRPNRAPYWVHFVLLAHILKDSGYEGLTFLLLFHGDVLPEELIRNEADNVIVTVAREFLPLAFDGAMSTHVSSPRTVDSGQLPTRNSRDAQIKAFYGQHGNSISKEIRKGQEIEKSRTRRLSTPGFVEKYLEPSI